MPNAVLWFKKEPGLTYPPPLDLGCIYCATKFIRLRLLENVWIVPLIGIFIDSRSFCFQFYVDELHFS